MIATDTIQAKDLVLKPGGSEKYARIFVVGARGDVASVVAELTHAEASEESIVAAATGQAESEPG